jgi:hypothetical protein
VLRSKHFISFPRRNGEKSDRCGRERKVPQISNKKSRELEIEREREREERMSGRKKGGCSKFKEEIGRLKRVSYLRTPSKQSARHKGRRRRKVKEIDREGERERE